MTLQYGGHTKRASAADIGAWYVPEGQTMQLSADKIVAYAQQVAGGFGITAYNAQDAAQAALYALQGHEVTFVLAAENTPAKYTYCAELKGVDASHAANFRQKAAAVLGDPRGWSAGGRAAFHRVDSGCNFTLWLSAPGLMTSFGGLCDSYWSCRSGRNVVVNFDRWQGATDAWNAAGGSLEDYRVMVTNHEVGHWLGFGHRNCPGAGQPAPVMQQQSMSLQSCTFNPWPTQPELNSL
jgi:hypothetical protein